MRTCTETRLHSRSGLSRSSLAAGSVADADTGGFTLVEPDGTKVAMTTGSSTTVVSLTTVNVDQLQVGKSTIAFGTPSQGETLAASRVEQEAMSTSGLPQSKQIALPEPKSIASQPDVGCSSSAVA